MRRDIKIDYRLDICSAQVSQLDSIFILINNSNNEIRSIPTH